LKPQRNSSDSIPQHLFVGKKYDDGRVKKVTAQTERKESISGKKSTEQQAQVIIFESNEEAWERKFPKNKVEVEILIGDFFVNKKIIRLPISAASCFTADLRTQLKKANFGNAEFLFAAAGVVSGKKSTFFKESPHYGSSTILNGNDLRDLQLFKTMTLDYRTYAVILQKEIPSEEDVHIRGSRILSRIKKIQEKTEARLKVINVEEDKDDDGDDRVNFPNVDASPATPVEGELEITMENEGVNEDSDVEVTRPIEFEEVSPSKQKEFMDALFDGPDPLPKYDDSVTFRDNSPLHNTRIRAAVNAQGFKFASIMKYAQANIDVLQDIQHGCCLCDCGFNENCINDIVVVNCTSDDCYSFFFHGSCLCVHILKKGFVHCPSCQCARTLQLVKDITKFKPESHV